MNLGMYERLFLSYVIATPLQMKYPQTEQKRYGLAEMRVWKEVAWVSSSSQ